MKLKISDLNTDREWSAATGLTQTQFEKLLVLFTASHLELYGQSVAERQAEIDLSVHLLFLSILPKPDLRDQSEICAPDADVSMP